jgi:hypothetical protein
MGLGTFDTFLEKLGELKAESPTSADVILDVARQLADHGNQMKLPELVAYTHYRKADLLRAVLQGQAAGLFAIGEGVSAELRLTPAGASFVLP